MSLDSKVVEMSFQKECTELKHEYDACYTVWFTDKFLKGETNDDIVEYPMEACRQLKDEYESCFNFWFAEKFLKGDRNDSMCSGLLKSYTDCVQVQNYFPGGFHKAMKENNISIKEIENDIFEAEKNLKTPNSK